MFKTAVCISIVFLALAWRCVGITFDSLWLDEGYQSIVDAYALSLPDFTQVPERPFLFKPTEPADPAQMLRNFRNVDPLTPPLYQLLLNRWIAAFGGSDLALRLLSVLISSLSVGVLFWFTQRCFGLKAAICVGVLQAFSPFDIYYGQEVRMYALVVLCASLSCALLFMLLLHVLRARARLPAWAAYVVSTWALINAHYTGLFVVLLQGVLGLAFALMRRSWRLFAILTVSWIGVGLLWLPWWHMFASAAKIRTASFYVAREPSLWWPPYALLVKIPANWVEFLAGKQVVAPAIPIYLTSVILLILSGLAIPRLRRKPRLMVLLVAAWAIVPAVALWLIDVLENRKVIEIARYTIATSPAIYILAGVGTATFLRRKRRWVAILFAAHLFFATVNNIGHAFFLHQREPWKQLAAALEQHTESDELVVVAQHYNIVCLDRYLNKPFRQVGMSTNMPDEHLERILPVKKFALVTAQEGEALAQRIPLRFKLVKRFDYAHGLHLRFYESQS